MPPSPAQPPLGSASVPNRPGPIGPALFAHACQIGDEVGAEALLILADGSLDWAAIHTRAAGRRVLLATTIEEQRRAAAAAGLIGLALDPTDAPVIERARLALIQAVSDDLLTNGARVVVIYAAFEPDMLDTVSVLRLGEHLERLTARDLRALETRVPFETLKAVVDVAVEIGREGREGNPVGTLIVVGDTREVLARTQTIGFNPFKGYRRKDRNIRDPRVREAIKEIAQLDGAFVVSRDGTVEAACQMIDAPTADIKLPRGLGTRHWAAAAISKVTAALAVAVSQSTGMVRLFQGGELVLRITPTRQARALKWHDTEADQPTRTERPA